MAKKIIEPKTLEELEALMAQDMDEAMKKLKEGMQDPPYEISPEAKEMLKKQMGDDWVEED